MKSIHWMILLALLHPLPLLAQDDAAVPSTPEALRLDGDEIVLRLREGERLSFEHLLRFAHQQTGRSFIYDDAETFGRTVPFVGQHRVAKVDFLEFTRMLLAHADFLCLAVPGTDGSILRVKSTRDAKRGELVSLAPFVAADAIRERAEWWRHQAGQIITTAVRLENLDARQTFSSLRTYFTNGDVESIAPSDNSDSLVVSAEAPKVVEFVELLQELDRQGRSELRRFDTGDVPAEQAAALVRSYFEQLDQVDQDQKRKAGPVPPQDRIAVLPVPGESALVVYAAPSWLDRVGELLEKMK